MEPLLHPHGIVWNCNVCAQPYKDIFILPCQHKFCERCLHIWVGVYTDTYRPGHQEFPCRVCWQINYLPKEGLQAYCRNSDISQLELDLSNLNMQTENNEAPTNPFFTNNKVGVLSAAQLDTLNRTNTSNSYNEPATNVMNQNGINSQQQQLADNNIKMSSSAPEFNASSFITDSNDMEMSNTQSFNSMASPENTGYGTPFKDNIPIADCDRMMQRRLCFPSTCNMYHHMM